MEMPVSEAPLRTATGQTVDGRRIEDIVAPPRPLLRAAPRSAMFFPLVVVAAVLPGLYALSCWDLSPPGPWWGMRGLAVLDGLWLDQVPMRGLGSLTEVSAYRAVAYQPPLYVWLEALCLAISGHRNPQASVLPSYALGALAVVFVYLHGRLWRGRGVGLVAAVLMAFHRDLLMQMQQASPVTLALSGVLGTLLCYAAYLRDAEGRNWIWIVSGGVALGLSLLSVGMLGLVVVPIILLHTLLLSGGSGAPSRRGARWRWLVGPGARAGLAAIGIALAVSIPWHVHMASRYGDAWFGAILAPAGSIGLAPYSGLGVALLSLAPATLPLALLAAVRACRRLLAEEATADGTVAGDAFWLAWLAVAAILPAFWPAGPHSLMSLLLLVPLNLLAAQAVNDLATRQIAARNLVWLAPTTALSVAWWFSAGLRAALSALWHGHRPDAATLLGLHLALDLIMLLTLLISRLDHWARRRDTRRRLVLGVYLAAVAAVTIGTGLREIGFRHRETAELLDLRRAILRRVQARPFWMVATVGPDGMLPGIAGPPGGRLRFVLRATLPHLSQLDLARPEDLLSLAQGEPPGAQRLVVLIGNERPLPYRQQSQLNLEAIYSSDSGLLQAFATTTTPPRRGRP